MQGSYNVSFVKPTSETIRLEVLNRQAQIKGLFRFREITVLGGRQYVEVAEALFHQDQTLILPLKDCKGIGFMMRKLNHMVEEYQPSATRQKEATVNELQRSRKLPSNYRGKYVPLFRYLETQKESSITLLVGQIESILRFTLPPSSMNYRAWWSNDPSHSQANAWLSAGWVVDKVSIPRITFKKTNDFFE